MKTKYDSACEAKEGKPIVAVLLSTFNGEKYLEQLLDSVLSQEGVEVRLIVRDDGSTDGTCEMLRKYADRDSHVTVHECANIGVIKSFNELMADQLVDECDYVSFCDQDDVWLPNKLASAISRLKQSDKCERPVMYCSNLMVVDEKLYPQREMRNRIVSLTREGVLVQNIGTGCTEVFNQKAREVYLRGVEARMEMHDYWMTLVCMFFGEVIYDEEPHILYRQHGANVIGASKRSIISAIRNIHKSGEGKRSPMLQDFIAVYGDLLSKHEIDTMESVCASRCSLFARIHLVLSPRYVGFDNKVTCGFKLRAALGKMY